MRRLRGRRGRPLGLALLALLLAALVGPETRPLRTTRLAGFDAYQTLAPRLRVSAPAVIVAVDEPSLARHGQWPWPRTLLARLVTIIGGAGPAAIGVDILMPEPDRLSPGRLATQIADVDRPLAERLSRLESNDAAFARAIRDLPVVLGVAGLETRAAAAASALDQAPVRTVGPDPRPLVRRFEAVLGSIDEIHRAAAGRGLLSADVEAGVVRRIPLVAVVSGVLVPTLGLEMLRVAAREPAFSVMVGRGGVDAVAVGDLSVPSSPDGSAWVAFSPHEPARFVSAGDVLAGDVSPAAFEGKLVLVGVTAIGLSDHVATPVSGRMPGVEIHAQLLEAIFDGVFLSRPDWMRWAEAAVAAAAGLLLILALPRLSARLSAALGGLIVAGVLGLGWLAYLQWRVLFDAASVALGLGVLYTSLLGASLAAADSQRRALRREVEAQRLAAARLAGELAAARRIQMGTLPTPGRAFPGERRFEIYARLEPAREVGGDLYDFFALDDQRLVVMIGDVSGKGLPASLFMAVAKALHKSAAIRGSGDIATVIAEANVELSRDNAEAMFVTAFTATLDVRTGELRYCNAGHDRPYLLPRGSGPVRRLGDGGGPPLCVIEGFPYAAERHWMDPGEALCLFTDGVTEAMNGAGEMFGRPRLEALLATLDPAASAGAIGEAIRVEVARFAAGVDPADDIAIVVLRWHGPDGDGERVTISAR